MLAIPGMLDLAENHSVIDALAVIIAAAAAGQLLPHLRRDFFEFEAIRLTTAIPDTVGAIEIFGPLKKGTEMQPPRCDIGGRLVAFRFQVTTGKPMPNGRLQNRRRS